MKAALIRHWWSSSGGGTAPIVDTTPVIPTSYVYNLSTSPPSRFDEREVHTPTTSVRFKLYQFENFI